MSNPKRCAACKSLRRRCSKDCVLAPYFPSNDPQRFAYVHRIFGASNISRMLMQIPVDQRAEAADSMSFEAKSRVKDPVYGCVAVIGQLYQQISAVQRELAKTQGQLAIYTAQQEQQMVSTQGYYGEPSWLGGVNAIQPNTFHFNQQSLMDLLRLRDNI
ncbi:hypothetical protein GIB67_013827 [Kingdonia uniflora]|uniref:LOB domain-containing protein n=1 Tax=Kingdonia uniflora TaxID=39325 RepID=A0A7J7N3Z6_9MAGN|nr:hypothetical protein GIB67_013827 [Kingdonia uniflora]